LLTTSQKTEMPARVAGWASKCQMLEVILVCLEVLTASVDVVIYPGGWARARTLPYTGMFTGPACGTGA